MSKFKSTKGDVKVEDKRYTLCEYCGIVPKSPRIFYSEEGYKHFLEKIDELNAREIDETSKGEARFYYGNVICEHEGENEEEVYKVTVHIYNRLTPKMTISEIDALTSNNTEDEIIERYRPYLRTEKPNKPDINIMYFEEKNRRDRKDKTPVKRIKYIPVLYKDDKRYMDRDFIKKCVYEMAHLHDYHFFEEMVKEFRFHHIVGEELDNISKLVNECAIGEDRYYSLADHAMKLYDEIIKERKKDGELCRNEQAKCLISRRRLRDFAFFVRNYMIPSKKRINPMKYRYQLTPRQLEILKLKEERKQIKQMKQNSKRKDAQNAEQLRLF